MSLLPGLVPNRTTNKRMTRKPMTEREPTTEETLTTCCEEESSFPASRIIKSKHVKVRIWWCTRTLWYQTWWWRKLTEVSGECFHLYLDRRSEATVGLYFNRVVFLLGDIQDGQRHVAQFVPVTDESGRVTSDRATCVIPVKLYTRTTTIIIITIIIQVVKV